eukprot:c28085_g2_i1 orf=68-226(+)
MNNCTVRLRKGWANIFLRQKKRSNSLSLIANGKRERTPMIKKGLLPVHEATS